MAVKKNIRTLKLYNLLLHEVSVLNRQQPENKRLSRKEVYDYISNKLYPKYKNLPLKQVKKTELRTKIANKLRSVKKKPSCNLLDYDPQEYTEGVQYFDIDSFIQNLPKCVYVRVNAGEQFGKTEIFNTRNYNYYTSKVNDITNNINEEIRKKGTNLSYNNVSYFGEIQLRPHKKNDGKEDSYYLEMILEMKGTPAIKPKRLNLPERKKTKKQIKEEAVTKSNKKRVLQMQPEKSEMKKINKKILKIIHNWKEMKKQLRKRKTSAILANEIYNQALELLDESKGKITQSQYERLLNLLKDAFNKN